MATNQTSISFKVLQKDTHSHARLGKLITPHGEVETPQFIPVGTQATVKTLAPQELKAMGAQIMLANNYHLHLRPGEDVVKKMGGLAKFMSWEGPTMTDSGGFQVFSLGAAQKSHNVENLTGEKLSKFSKSPFLYDQGEGVGETESSFVKKITTAHKIQAIKPAKIDEEGVTFYSHIDGSQQRFDPFLATRMQESLGADLIVAFDDHESPLWDYKKTKLSLERTNRWGVESLQAQTRSDQLMYGVIHGGIYEDLRKESATFTDAHFPAIAIGGSYTSKQVLYDVIDWTIPNVSEDKPRHLLGIAEVQDLFEAVERGIDFFDCVAPTRRGRHGNVYIHPKNGGRKEKSFVLQITKKEYELDAKPIDPGCACFTCQNFTRSYLHHLALAKESLGQRLSSYHNMFFILQLVKQIRESLKEGRFQQMKEAWLG